MPQDREHGKRQRERLTIENVPKEIAKPKTYLGKPSLEKHKGSNSKCRTDIRTPEASNNASGCLYRKLKLGRSGGEVRQG